jgi:hypothetical protein
MSLPTSVAPHVDPTPKASDLSSTDTITWDNGLPIIDVVQVLANASAPSAVLFQDLHNCNKRMLGRAYARITNLTVEIISDPDYAIKAVVGIVPTSATTGNAPSNMAELMTCGAVLLKESPFAMSGSKSPRFMPGVSSILVGESVKLLVGAPPTLYFMAQAVNLENWKKTAYTARSSGAAATGTPVFFQISYTLELSGYGYLKPF